MADIIFLSLNIAFILNLLSLLLAPPKFFLIRSLIKSQIVFKDHYPFNKLCSLEEQCEMNFLQNREKQRPQ